MIGIYMISKLIEEGKLQDKLFHCVNFYMVVA